MTDVVASDLDRTLIYSARAGGTTSGARCVEEYDGKPLSYVAEAVLPLLGRLVSTGSLVPVTTRTEAQYRRISLPGGPARFAICLNGGRVLVDGEDDPNFREVLERVLASGAPADEALALLEAWASAPSLGPSRVRDAEGLFHYAVFDDPISRSAATDALAGKAERLGWQVSVQGRKLYLVPQALTKEAALGYLEQAHGVRVLGSAGDSLLDRGMLDRFGPSWVPKGSELELTGAVPTGTRLTSSPGLAAGAEIVERLASLVPGARKATGI